MTDEEKSKVKNPPVAMHLCVQCENSQFETPMCLAHNIFYDLDSNQWLCRDCSKGKGDDLVPYNIAVKNNFTPLPEVGYQCQHKECGTCCDADEIFYIPDTGKWLCDDCADEVRAEASYDDIDLVSYERARLQ